MSDSDVNIGDKEVVIDRHSSPISTESDDHMMAVAEYSIVDDCCQRLGYALITTGSTFTGIELDMDATISEKRKFHGATNAHKWKALQDLCIENKIDIKIGDHIVVIGIYDREKNHIADPAGFTSRGFDNPLKTFTIKSEIFSSASLKNQIT